MQPRINQWPASVDAEQTRPKKKSDQKKILAVWKRVTFTIFNMIANATHQSATDHLTERTAALDLPIVKVQCPKKMHQTKPIGFDRKGQTWNWPTFAKAHRLSKLAKRSFDMCSRRRQASSARIKSPVLVDMLGQWLSMGRARMETQCDPKFGGRNSSRCQEGETPVDAKRELDIIDWATAHYKCPVCETRQRPLPAPGRSMRALEFNVVVGIDLFLLDVLEKTYTFFILLWWGKNFEQIGLCKDKSSLEVLNTFAND